MVEKELVRDSNSLRDNFLTLINTKDIMNTVEIQQNFDRVFVHEGYYEGGNRSAFPTLRLRLLANLFFRGFNIFIGGY